MLTLAGHEESTERFGAQRQRRTCRRADRQHHLVDEVGNDRRHDEREQQGGDLAAEETEQRGEH